jgi:hypothetical protein
MSKRAGRFDDRPSRVGDWGVYVLGSGVLLVVLAYFVYQQLFNSH